MIFMKEIKSMKINVNERNCDSQLDLFVTVTENDHYKSEIFI